MLTKDKVLKGRYRIIDQLGQSEAGAVYEAYDSIRKANVALKEILIDSEKVPAITERESLKRQFADRAKMLAEVKHESLPQIRGYFSEFDRQYLVIELISGDNAGEILLKNEKPISFSDAANWADQLLDALDYLHTLTPPIVHGDVTPANVKLNSRGRIKLLGFDITESVEAKIQTIITNQNFEARNAVYLPLEQLVRVVNANARKEFSEAHKENSEKVFKLTADARSDIYAIGATLYHLITGQTPVDALERAQAVWAKDFDPLPSVHELNPAIPVEVSDVLAKAMEIEAEKRFGSAMEMRQGLQTAVARAQERQIEEAKNRDTAAARETLLAEEKRLEQERQSVEQERVRLEEERRQQTELIEQQLKAAETERLKAEQRAAEAEKQLLKEKAASADEKKSLRTSAGQKPLDADAATTKTSERKPEFGESSGLLAETDAGKKSSWVIPVIIGVILMVVGAGGFVVLRSPKNVAAESKQPAVNQTTAPADNPAPAPTVEAAAPPATVDKTSAATTPAPVSPTIATDKTASQPAPKNKPAAAPQPAVPRAEKPVAAPKPATQKKAVTVDDLIGN